MTVKTCSHFVDLETLAYERALALSGMPEVVPLQTVFDDAMKERASLARDKRRNGWTKISADCGLVEIMNDVADFFRIGGVRARMGGREVASWLQPMLMRETGGFITTMWQHDDDPEEDVFWLRLKAEPGNEGIVVPTDAVDENERERLVNEKRVELQGEGMLTNVLICPVFQGSKGNLTAHNVPLAKLISDLEQAGNMTWNPTPEDGGRFLRKTNKEAVIGINEDAFTKAVSEFPAIAPDFFGATRPVVRAAMRRGWLNPFAKRGVGMARF